MPLGFRAYRIAAVTLVSLCSAHSGIARRADGDPATSTPSEWTATDSIRFETHLGRPSVYINKGVAMSRTANFRNGTIEFDMAAGPQSSNMGIAFRAQRPDAFEVLFFRPGASGRVEAIPSMLRQRSMAWARRGRSIMAPGPMPTSICRARAGST